VELQQSSVPRLISDSAVQQTLALMGQPKEARLTSEVAQQICERTRVPWFWKARSPALGDQYVLSLRAKNCHTGNTVEQQQVQVSSEKMS
jgi:alkylated DNA nucleotide flippase Atl1